MPRDRVMTASRAKLAWQKQRHAELRNTLAPTYLARSTYAIGPFVLGRQVSAALAGYLAAVEETETTVRLELQALSNMLVANNDLPVIAQVHGVARAASRV